jgi:hypothetical protein
VLREQVQELNQSQPINTKWLDPTVNVLQTFSETLGEGVGSVCFRTELVRDSPSHICLTGILTRKGDFYRVWCSTFSVYPSQHLCAIYPIRTILRQLRPFARTKTLFLRCSSA